MVKKLYLIAVGCGRKYPPDADQPYNLFSLTKFLTQHWFYLPALLLLPLSLSAGEDAPKPKEFKCSVDRPKPQLFYDFRFHAPFTVRVSRRQLEGPENELRFDIRVTPLEPAGEPVYFQNDVTVEQVTPGRGTIEFSGSFALGEGKYQVAWTLADNFRRTCTVEWEVRAQRKGKDKHVELAIEPGDVAMAPVYPFRPLRTKDLAFNKRPLRVKLLVNFSPMSRRRSTLRPWEVIPLAAMIREVARQPEFTEIAVVAFSLEDQKVFFRQPYRRNVDLPGLGRAMEELSPGTVDLDELGKKRELDYLGQLLADELGELRTADVVILASPKQPIWDKVEREYLSEATDVTELPLFYLSYNPFHPRAFPWRDAIGNAVLALGGTELRVTHPRDVQLSIDRIVEEAAAHYRIEEVESKAPDRSGYRKVGPSFSADQPPPIAR